MLKTVQKLVKSRALLQVHVQKAYFGGHGHEVKEYDWRDDPKVNNDIYVDPRDRGWDPTTYTFPYEGRDDWFFPINGDAAYKPGDVSLNLRPEHKKGDVDYTGMRAPYWNERAEVAHEADYESEDLDFQAEDFKMQHFRKKGPNTMYFFVGNLFILGFWLEFIAQHYPDEDHWRISRPPPLDYPDTDDTDDTQTFEDYHSKDGRYLVETAAIGELWFDIKDGEKIIKPTAGGNQPMPEW